MFDKRTIVFFIAILTLAVFVFIYAKGSVDISLNNSPEVGHAVVLKYPFWVSESKARLSFNIEPDIEGELQWIEEENTLHFVPTEGFEPETDYIISANKKLSALLPISKDKVIRVSMAALQNYMKPKVDEGTYIDANLHTMTLSLYKNGEFYKAYPIAGKGHPRLSPTVEGTFSIKTKEPNHFSTIAYVWMPFSMQFYGNYFIHAWPYWPGGAELTSKYSGGCVRLFKEDAQEVYDFASIGMKMIIHSTPSHRLNEINNGDLIYLESDSNAYLIKIKDGVRFKRILPRSKILAWYPHLAPLDEHMKLVSKDILNQFESSRWVQLSGSERIYEIGLDEKKHIMTCGDNRCIDIWAEYGWDPRELYTISEEEFASYPYGGNIELPRAPWVQ